MEFRARLFVLLAGGDVARDFRGADDSPVGVLYGRYLQGDVDAAAASMLPHRFHLDRVAGPNPRENVILFVTAVEWNDDRDRLADRLALGVAEHAFGRPIPRHDDAVQILADDCI